MIEQKKLKALICMMLWAVFFVAAMSLNKLLDKSIPTEIIVFYRLMFGFMWLSPFLVKKYKTVGKTKVIHLHIIRSFFTAFTIGCTYYSYRNLPLAMATSIGLSGPLFTSFLAAFFLKEKLTLKKIGVILFGYIGVLLVVGPQFSNTVALNAIGVAIMGNISIGFVIILMKKVTQYDSVETTLFYNTTLTLTLCILYAHSSIYIPETKNLLLLIGIGMFGISVQFMYTTAISYADASFVSPLEYFRVICAIPIGLFFFNESLSILDFIGTTFIIISTYLISKYE